MQSKKQSCAETTTQVITDVAGNVFIAIPLAYFLHEIKLEAITEIFFVMLIYNFGKSYGVRRFFENKKRQREKIEGAMRPLKWKGHSNSSRN